MAPPGFCNRGEVRYGSIGGLEYDVPQSRLYCLCINVALCSTALRCICRVIHRSSMTMKADTYYIIFRRPPIRGKLPPPSLLAAPLVTTRSWGCTYTVGTLPIITVHQPNPSFGCTKLSNFYHQLTSPISNTAIGWCAGDLPLSRRREMA